MIFFVKKTKVFLRICGGLIKFFLPFLQSCEVNDGACELHGAPELHNCT